MSTNQATALAAMRDAFMAMLAEPDAAAALQSAAMRVIDQQHADNRVLFGWHAAELLRALAIHEATAQAQSPLVIPVGDATDSDFATFKQESQQ